MAIGVGVAVIGFCGMYYRMSKGISEDGRKEEATRALEEWGGTPQIVNEWSEEDVHWRAYSWTAPDIDESLKRMLRNLSSDDTWTRNWLLETRPVTSSAVGVGLGAASPPLNIRPASPMPTHKRLPRSREGPGNFAGGSYAKYAELLEEWQTGKQTQVCEGGKWQDDYTKMHDEMLKGDREPKLLEYICPVGQNCGGLTDRMLGLTTTFFYAILTGRAFAINFQQPMPVDILFDSPFIDWSRRWSPPGVVPVLDQSIWANKEILAGKVFESGLNWGGEVVDQHWGDFFQAWLRPLPKWISIFHNRGVILRSFRNPQVGDRILELGFKASTVYNCLVNYLLRPKPAVLNFIAQYTSFFALPSNFVIGVQIRCGDSSMVSESADLLNTVERYQPFFQCAEQVARVYAKPSQKIVYFLISDSNNLKKMAVEAYPDRVVLSGMNAQHAEIAAGEGYKATDGMMTTIAESWALASTDFQILTESSGFGKFPTWLRGKYGSTIQISFDPAKPPVAVDCRSDTLLKTFSQMSDTWSLG